MTPCDPERDAPYVASNCIECAVLWGRWLAEDRAWVEPKVFASENINDCDF